MAVDDGEGTVIGNPEEAFWTDIEKKCEQQIERSNHEIEINEHLKLLAKQKMEEHAL